jgi:hypothetical protein
MECGIFPPVPEEDEGFEPEPGYRSKANYYVNKVLVHKLEGI